MSRLATLPVCPKRLEFMMQIIAEAGEKASLTPLPGTLAEAVSAAEASPFVKGVVGEPLLSKYLLQKRREAEDCRRAESMDAFTRKRYFHLI